MICATALMPVVQKALVRIVLILFYNNKLNNEVTKGNARGAFGIY